MSEKAELLIEWIIRNLWEYNNISKNDIKYAYEASKHYKLMPPKESIEEITTEVLKRFNELRGNGFKYYTDSQGFKIGPDGCEYEEI